MAKKRRPKNGRRKGRALDVKVNLSGLTKSHHGIWEAIGGHHQRAVNIVRDLHNEKARLETKEYNIKSNRDLSKLNRDHRDKLEDLKVKQAESDRAHQKRLRQLEESAEESNFKITENHLKAEKDMVDKRIKDAEKMAEEAAKYTPFSPTPPTPTWPGYTGPRGIRL